MTTTVAPPRTEDDVVRELTDLLFKVKMLEFELGRIRDPRPPTFSREDALRLDVAVEWEIAAARARSMAKLEAGL